MQAGQSQQGEAAGSPALLIFDAVSCARGGRMLFTDLSFTLEAGNAIRIVGPNGVGKSSLLRLAAGLLDPAGGTIARSTSLALANEDSALDRDVSVMQALDFWRHIDGGSNAGVSAATETMGCAHLGDIPVRLLSTGQRKRVAIPA